MKRCLFCLFILSCTVLRGQSLLTLCDSQPGLIRYELPERLMQLHFHCKGSALCPHCAFADSAFRVIAEELRTLPIVAIDIAVHADLRGSQEFNDSLTRKQALEIYERLQKHGIDSTGMTYTGKGEREPLIAEALISSYKRRDRRAYETLHLQNRRFELYVFLYSRENVREPLQEE